MSINLNIILVLPNYLNYCGFKNDYWDLAILGFYMFIFFTFWFFLYFLISEIKHAKRKKISFFKHVIKNKLVLSGVVPFFTYLFLRFTEGYFCS